LRRVFLSLRLGETSAQSVPLFKVRRDLCAESPLFSLRLGETSAQSLFLLPEVKRDPEAKSASPSP